MAAIPLQLLLGMLDNYTLPLSTRLVLMTLDFVSVVATLCRYGTSCPPSFC